MSLHMKIAEVRQRRDAILGNAKGSLTGGKITDEEKEKIGKAKDDYSYSEGLVDKYAAKLRSAQEETQKRTGAVKPRGTLRPLPSVGRFAATLRKSQAIFCGAFGTFYAKAAQNLRGNQMEQRMLTVTQEIEKHTKKAAELLKDGTGSSMEFQ